MQSSCRCLREVDNAQFETAYICLSEKNKKVLEKELYNTYRMTIEDLEAGNEDMPQSKKYPVQVLDRPKRKIKYNNVTIKTKVISETSTNNIDNKLNSFTLGKFQNKYPFENKEENLVIGENGLES